MYKKYTDYYVSGFHGHCFKSLYAPTLLIALDFCAHLDIWCVFHAQSVVARSVGMSVVPINI